MRVISDIAAEFPHIDDRYIGRPYRYAFMQATGMVNDHIRPCLRHDAVRAMGEG